MEYNELKPEEAAVIENKGTERPGSGEYDDWFRDGAYLCRRCDSPLYQGSDKFRSGCGWPSFDDEIEGAVKKTIDQDGVRTEILCVKCGAHLGHVFSGEKLTDKDVRHCVNSMSLKFIPDDFLPGEEHFAVLGGGCFWCLDAYFRQTEGVRNVVVGYAGGRSLAPTYERIDGHAEVAKIVYDPAVLDFRKILEIFFRMHDPTTLDRQGNDVGKQYRSIILFATWQQEREAKEILGKLEETKVYEAPIVTELKPLTAFYRAEEYHQDYYRKNPGAAYCQLVVGPKVEKFREIFGA